VWFFVWILTASGLWSSAARAEVSVPGTTAKLRWTPAAGATDARYFVYVSRNGSTARIETSVTGTEVTLNGLSGDVISVSVSAVAGTVVGPRSAVSEPIRFGGGTPPPPGRLAISCASCGASAMVRFPGGAAYGVWQHPAGGVWDLVDIGRFTSAATTQGLFRERAAGGWLVATLGSDAITPVASIVKGVFAASMPLSGDLDGDGVLEILIQDRADNDIEVWQVDNGSLVRAVRMPLGGAFTPFAIEDLDGDGQRDLWFQHDTSGAVAVLRTRNLDDQSTVTLASTRPFEGARVADVADYDGDGLFDLLWRNDQGLMAVSLLRGDPLRPTASLRPVQERSGDDKLLPRDSLDLDGQPGAEIVVQNYADGSTHLVWADTSGRRQLVYVPPGGARWGVLSAMR
jgi:hypothetical protein